MKISLRGKSYFFFKCTVEIMTLQHVKDSCDMDVKNHFTAPLTGHKGTNLSPATSSFSVSLGLFEESCRNFLALAVQ